MNRMIRLSVAAFAVLVTAANATVYQNSYNLYLGGEWGDELRWSHFYDGSVDIVESATLTIVADDVDDDEDHYVSLYCDGVWRTLGRLRDMGYTTLLVGYKDGPGCYRENRLTTTVFYLNPSWLASHMPVKVRVDSWSTVEVETSTLRVEGYTLVGLDIKPGSDPNSINLRSKGLTPVAILSTDDFDAATVDPESVLIGDPLLSGAIAPVRWVYCDVPEVANPDYDPSDSDSEPFIGDGDLDLLLYFSTPDFAAEGALGLASEEAVLTALTWSGDAILGLDSVRVVPGSAR